MMGEQDMQEFHGDLIYLLIYFIYLKGRETESICWLTPLMVAVVRVGQAKARNPELHPDLPYE